MGIFNRKDGVEEIFGNEQDISAPTGTVANPNPNPMAQARPPEAKARVVKTNPNAYGIEDAIKLMRQLPNVDSEILITVVNKTLESANIKVAEIISDAETKENNIGQRNSSLSTRIEQLQKEISQLNSEITTLTDDLKETTKVKNLLMLTVGKANAENRPPAAAQASAKPQKQQQQQEQPAGPSAVGKTAQI